MQSPLGVENVPIYVRRQDEGEVNEVAATAHVPLRSSKRVTSSFELYANLIRKNEREHIAWTSESRESEEKEIALARFTEWRGGCAATIRLR